MINSMQTALIKKDIRSVTANKNVFLTMLLVPLVMTVVIPSAFVIAIAVLPEDSADFQDFLHLLPDNDMSGGELREFLMHYVWENIVPLFFLMIPVMTATVMAASSFVGEKEKRTLETLLYCPMSLGQIFFAKIFASFLISQFVSLASFVVMTLVVQTEIWFFTRSLILPGLNWLVLMLLLSPALSLVSISLIVRGSAKSKSTEEAMQKSVFLIMPLIIVVVAQSSGAVAISKWLLLGFGVVFAVVGLVLLRRSSANLHYERLLR